MKLAWFLFQNNRRKTALIMAMAVISGVASTGVIAFVNKAVYAATGGRPALAALGPLFLGIVAIKVISAIASGLLLGHLLQDIVLKMCDSLCRKVAGTPFRKLEQIGAARITACLTDDVAVLSAALQAIPGLVVNLAVLAGCALYLAWISRVAALALVILVVAVAITYKLLVAKAIVAIVRAREGRDTLFKHFRTLVEGIKELKLHRRRSEAFFSEDIHAAADYLRLQNVEAMNRYAFADAWSQSMFYALIGVVLFVLPLFQHVDARMLTAYIFVALYVMNPVWGIIGSIPTFNRGQASLEKLRELGVELEDFGAGAEPQSGGAVTFAAQEIAVPPLVDFKNVVFRYDIKGSNEIFVLGPLNLTIQPNELLFIIGGNGSGKSTLARLLTGLYLPDSGTISVNGQPVSAAGQANYQQMFSAVFSDFYLFDRLLGMPKSAEIESSAKSYLRTLELSDKVQVQGNALSTVALSQGQRRRLALLAAYMEDRPIYVLDEWAADQDPRFREIFYLKLLPELRSRGKTVVVITHDDRYFHVGDRVVKLDYGKVVSDSQVAIEAGKPVA